VRVLLDEQLPRQLARYISGHEVRTVQQEGWAGLKNGELLRRAVAGRFEVFITADRVLRGNVCDRPRSRRRRDRPRDGQLRVSAYRSALLARFDAQIRLLRSAPYWYLFPLSIWPVWVFAHAWSKNPWRAAVGMVLLVVTFGGVGWLNVVVGVRFLRGRRARVESMFPQE
jgi:hypothetical protein